MSPPTSSTPAAAKPSVLLALVAASIVGAFDSTWLARPVAELARGQDVSPERVSRLKTRVLALFEPVLLRASQRGRRAAPPEDASLARAGAAEALLAVATELLDAAAVRGRAVREQLVAAQERIARDHGVSVRAFCSALAVPERTFRSWRRPAAEPAPPAPPESAAPPVTSDDEPKWRPRRGRFALSVTPPGVQAMADTTDWALFGVSLKVLAVQDPGARGVRVWDAHAVETSEDAEKVIAVVQDALADRPGTQLVTDQGTPYMAEATAQALQDLELEHAPQKEADPLGKSTLERSFRSVKDALAPLARLTARLAEAVPALRNPDFAAAAGRILVGTFLDVDRRAREGALRAAGAPHPDDFELLAEQNRARSRAETRSRRLALTRIHEAYDFPGSSAAFIRRFRRHFVADILEAERSMGTGACRCHARACDRYFAAILRRVAAENGRRRAAERRRRLQEQLTRREQDRLRDIARHREDHPDEWLLAALDRVAVQWQPDTERFVLGRSDPFRGELLRALRRLAELHPLSARDRAEAAWTRWARTRNELRPAATAAVREALLRSLRETLGPNPPSTSDLAASILRLDKQRRHPPPPPHLRL